MFSIGLGIQASVVLYSNKAPSLNAIGALASKENLGHLSDLLACGETFLGQLRKVWWECTDSHFRNGINFSKHLVIKINEVITW